MARWKTLLLAGALGCWPALGFAQGNLPVPPAAPGGDQGVPALPPGANTSTASVPVTVSGSAMMAPTTSRPGRVSLSDMGSRGNTVAGVPDVSGMPKAEGGMTYTGMNQMVMQSGDVQGSFMPAGANNFCAQCPVGIEPCGTTIQAKGPCGILVDGGVNWFNTRRNDPSVLFSTVLTTNFGDVNVSQQQDYNNHTGTGWWVGAGYLTADGWFGMVTYRSYKDTIENSRIFNDGTDPNFNIQYIGPGPLGSGAGGGDVPAGGFLDRFWDITWENLDIMGGTVISPAKCLDVTFAGGLRITKLEQNYNAFIDRGDGSSNGQVLFSRIQGVGIRTGMEARIYPCQPLTLYAKGYTSLIYANRLEQAAQLFVQADGPTTGSFTSYERQEILPVLELGFGADVSLFGGRLITGVGYDFNYLWEAGSTYSEQSTNPRAARHVNLAIDGLNVHMTLLW
ncbi:MAG TPA: Lpg1974 family pore-forming outer membrane protein [Gemmatales bacterium]|nr:Lpg1974 family pore-forming outer membrane protein [Gemmatales bacterium]